MAHIYSHVTASPRLGYNNTIYLVSLAHQESSGFYRDYCAS